MSSIHSPRSANWAKCLCQQLLHFFHSLCLSRNAQIHLLHQDQTIQTLDHAICNQFKLGTLHLHPFEHLLPANHLTLALTSSPSWPWISWTTNSGSSLCKMLEHKAWTCPAEFLPTWCLLTDLLLAGLLIAGIPAMIHHPVELPWHDKVSSI